MLNPPCKDCEKRHDLCHAHCPEYIQFCKDRRNELDKMHKANQLKYELYSLAMLRKKAADDKARDRMNRKRRGEHK